MHACTIVSSPTSVQGLVLARTFLAHHPSGGVTIVAIGDARERIQAHAEDGITVVDAATLPGVQIDLLGTLHGPEQLTQALVPYAARALLAEHEDVLLLAPWTRITAPLEGVASALDETPVLVLPRLIEDIPDDDHTPSFEDARELGAFDTGFLALRRGPAAEALLDRWPERFVAPWSATRQGPPPSPLQTWFDALPATAEGVGVLRDPGYGWAWWNAGLRPLEGANGSLTAAGRPLRVAVFQEFNPRRPHILHERQDRARASESPALAQLLHEHAGDLLGADALGSSVAAPAYSHLPDGTLLDERLRRLFREGHASGELTQTPFTQPGMRAFYDWLREPAGRGAQSGLNRYHERIWEERIDLRSAYPNLDGPDGDGFAGWVHAHGISEVPMPEALLPPEPAALSPSQRQQADPLWGVNVAGFFRSELGLGEAARLLIGGLDAANVPALPVQGKLVPPCRQEAEFAFAGPDDAPFPINIVCMNGDTIPVFAREVGERFFQDRHTIALWWWELNVFPEDWRAAYEHVDEIWVGSQLIHDAIAPTSPVPVVRVPLPVTMPTIVPHSREALGMPEGFVFLFVFDYHSTAARKNPVGTIEAFKRAFPPGSGASLVIKTINAENIPDEHERVLLAAAGHPDIHFINRYVSAIEKDAMVAACDCYVSLHRSEGFGLTPAEAMYLGKPVIATAYGGVLEFMTPENAYLVDYEMTRVGDRAHPYPADGIWADPDVEQAARLMRHVFEHQDEARERGRLAAIDIRGSHSPKVAGTAMAARLRVIHERLKQQGQHSTVIANLPPIDLNRVPGAGQVSGSNRFVRRVRRLLRKVLGPDVHLQNALSQSDARMREIAAELERHQRAFHTESLAGFRRARAGLRDTQRALDRSDGELRELAEQGRAERAALSRQVEQHLAEHTAEPYMAEDARFETWQDEGSGTVLGYRGGVRAADAYRSFTDAFRGSEQHVAASQGVYVELLRGHAPVLDIGCGRGELLELLGAAGVDASGVDGDRGMAEHCAAKGLDVVHGDALAHLATLGDGSLGGVVAIELIEHLGANALEELLAQVRRVLRPGGRFVADTVNPSVVHALHAFWVDPTHHHPLFPETVLQLCRIAGFETGFVTYPGGSGDVAADRTQVPVYAVVASA